MEKKIIIGSDHGGFGLKESLKNALEDLAYHIEDIGCYNTNSVHYPNIAEKVASSISTGKFEKGILICGTGIGMSIVANRFKQVRAALCHDHFTAKMAREHNDSNLLVLGGRVIGDEVAKDILITWLETDFQGGRHQERVNMIDQSPPS
ncbi:ribose 5-phosphate isomerase B [bacterium]|nr:ribose 5-phosphate isomerase B [bacterium]